MWESRCGKGGVRRLRSVRADITKLARKPISTSRDFTSVLRARSIHAFVVDFQTLQSAERPRTSRHWLREPSAPRCMRVRHEITQQGTRVGEAAKDEEGSVGSGGEARGAARRRRLAQDHVGAEDGPRKRRRVKLAEVSELSYSAVSLLSLGARVSYYCMQSQPQQCYSLHKIDDRYVTCCL